MSSVNVTKFITSLPPFQQLCAAILTSFLLCSAGYVASDHNLIKSDNEIQSFDVFSYKAQDEVKPMMDKALANPTEYNLRKANNHLKIGVQNWVNGEEGQNKELFQEYLDSCELVIDEKQAGNDITAEKAEMEKLYLKLNPEN
jgi:hypothetical protein